MNAERMLAVIACRDTTVRWAPFPAAVRKQGNLASGTRMSFGVGGDLGARRVQCGAPLFLTGRSGAIAAQGGGWYD